MNSEEERGIVKQFEPQMEVVFLNEETGEEMGSFDSQNYIPVPSEGEIIRLADTWMVEDGDDWKIDEQTYVDSVVTDVNFQYNNILFPIESGEQGVRLFVSIYITVRHLSETEAIEEGS